MKEMSQREWRSQAGFIRAICVKPVCKNSNNKGIEIKRLYSLFWAPRLFSPSTAYRWIGSPQDFPTEFSDKISALLETYNCTYWLMCQLQFPLLSSPSGQWTNLRPLFLSNTICYCKGLGHQKEHLALRYRLEWYSEGDALQHQRLSAEKWDSIFREQAPVTEKQFIYYSRTNQNGIWEGHVITRVL